MKRLSRSFIALAGNLKLFMQRNEGKGSGNGCSHGNDILHIGYWMIFNLESRIEATVEPFYHKKLV